MKEIRTINIDGIEVQTHLTPVEFANLPKKYAELQKENEDLKRDNGFYQDCMNIIKAVLHKSGFICQEVTNEEVLECDAEFVIRRTDEGTVQLFKQMVMGEFDEGE